MCSGNPKRAMQALDLGPTQAEAIEINAGLAEEPTARADEIYTGVLFSTLDLASLDAASRVRADESLAIASALFGLVRPERPHPGLPAVRRRLAAATRHGGEPLAHAAPPRPARRRRRRTADRPALRHVRRARQASRRARRSHRDDARAPRAPGRTQGRQPLQQGDQGPDRTSPARVRRRPGVGRRAAGRARRPRAGPSNATASASTSSSPRI